MGDGIDQIEQIRADRDKWRVRTEALRHDLAAAREVLGRVQGELQARCEEYARVIGELAVRVDSLQSDRAMLLDAYRQAKDDLRRIHVTIDGMLEDVSDDG
jgi:outer membrane murein-binding lipoprotein Lpp